MKMTLAGWLLARAADFLILSIVMAGSLISVGRAEAVLDLETVLQMASISFLVVYMGGGFVITSLVLWVVGARWQWPPVLLAGGSAGLLLATVTGIHLILHARGWSPTGFDVFVILNPFILTGIALHGFTTWIITAWVFRKRAASP